MSFLVDEDNDGHTMDEGFALATDVAGTGLTIGGAIAGGLGTLGGGLGAGAAAIGAGVGAVGAGLATAGGAAAALGAAGLPATAGLSTPLIVGGALAGMLGGGLMAGGGLLGTAGVLGGGLATGIGTAVGGAAIGAGQLLKTDFAGDAAAMLGDFTHDQLGGGEPDSSTSGGLIGRVYDHYAA